MALPPFYDTKRNRFEEHVALICSLTCLFASINDSKLKLMMQDVSKHGLLADVLIFPTGTDLHAHPWVANGSLILQVWQIIPGKNSMNVYLDMERKPKSRLFQMYTMVTSRHPCVLAMISESVGNRTYL